MTVPAEDARSPQVQEILNSDIGVQALLTRLKQSVTSTRDFAAFLKKRASLEDEHASGLRKLCRSTHESLRRPDSRQGSYLGQFEEMTRFHEKLADNGNNFGVALHQMHDELVELAGGMERSRKQLKQFGMSSEKKVHDAELLVEKAKLKYDASAEEFERVRTGDSRRTGKFAGLRGSKSGPQHEEELQKRVAAADLDYNNKVQSAIVQRQELMQTARPQTVNQLKEIVSECDAGLLLQFQKYAKLTEKMMLANGLVVSPYESNGLRQTIATIDNQKDFNDFVLEYASKMPAGAQRHEVRYERHASISQQGPPPGVPQTLQQAMPNQFPVQIPQQQQPQQPQQQQQQQQYQQPPQHQQQQQNPQHQQPPQHQQQQNPQQQQQQQQQSPIEPPTPKSPTPPQHLPQQHQHESTPNTPVQGNYQPFPAAYQSPSQPPQPPTQSGTSQPPPQTGFGTVVQAPAALPSPPPPSATPQHPPPTSATPTLPAIRPVFGVPLDDLLARDDSAVPIIVYQCIQAIDLYGLDVEGIYRVSSEKKHSDQLRAIFDNDAAAIDFRDPNCFFNDIHSVASVLKHFFRELPEPLLTHALHNDFLAAARLEDPTQRRDALHGLVNQLPDPNYATLRILAMHLYRVKENANVNRMNVGNLAICFGPTLMGGNGQENGGMSEAGWQVRVVQTIVDACYSIFE